MTPEQEKAVAKAAIDALRDAQLLIARLRSDVDEARAKLASCYEVAHYIINHFEELNGTECKRHCGTCIKCRLEELL